MRVPTLVIGSLLYIQHLWPLLLPKAKAYDISGFDIVSFLTSTSQQSQFRAAAGTEQKETALYQQKWKPSATLQDSDGRRALHSTRGIYLSEIMHFLVNEKSQ